MGIKAVQKPYYSKGAGPIGWVVAIVAPIAAVALSTASVGIAVLPFLVISAVVGVIFGAVAFYALSPNWARVALAVGFFGGMTILALAENRWLGGMPTWIFGAVSGGILGAHLRFKADQRHQAGATADSSSLRIEWNTGGKEFKKQAATVGELEEKIRDLDGRTSTIVSAVRGQARMDFCGDAQGAMVVFHSPDARDEDRWSLLTSAESGRTPAQVTIGELKGTFAGNETVGLAAALAAARAFATSSGADKSLTWWTSPEVFDRRPLPA